MWNNNERKRTFQSWSDMKQRCYNPKCHNYPNYGGRGITVCQRWLDSFQHFVTDMGMRSEGLTLERIDTNGNYEPANCRWATRVEQRRNQRDCIFIEARGKRMTSQQWADELHCDRNTIINRLRRGLTHEEIVSMPFKAGHKLAARKEAT